ncbi:MAG: mycofactocin biosynthesis glycosyltransferase MftF, partial [Bacillota bacterium]
MIKIKTFNSWDLLELSLSDGCFFVQMSGQWSIKGTRPRRQIFIRDDIHDLIAAFIDGKENLLCTAEQGDLLFTLAAKGYIDIKVGGWDYEEYDVPFISVIIPVKNRPEDIRDCLNSIFAVKWNKEKLEVIVVDDGSDDNTPQVAEELGAKVVRREKSGGPSVARNAGAAVASGEVLAFIDSDCTVDDTWLLDLTPYIMAPGIGALGGFVASYYNTTSLDRYEEAMSSLSMGKRLLYEASSEGNFYVPTCNMLVRKDVYNEVGCLNPEMHLGEDVDLCWRVRNSGRGLLYVTTGRAWHKHRNALFQMLKRRLQYGTSEADLYKRHQEKKKVFPVPVTALGFWLGLLLTVLTFNLWFLLLTAGSYIVNIFRKYLLVKKLRDKIGFGELLQIAWRTSVAFCYYMNFHLIRYYLILLIITGIFFPKLLLGILIALINCSAVDYKVKKPNLNYFQFLFFYLLEQVYY